MTEPVLRLENLQKNFGGLRVTDNVTLDILPGEMHAIIGPNGAGKTTLINQISGTASFRRRAHRFQRTRYHPPPDACARRAPYRAIVPDYVRAARLLRAGERRARSAGALNGKIFIASVTPLRNAH